MSKVLFATDCVKAAKQILSAREKWGLQEGPLVHWGGGQRKAISVEFETAIKECCDSTSDAGKEVEEKAKRLVLAFDDVAKFFRKWIQDASMQQPTAPPGGSDELVRAIDRLEQALHVPDLPLPPSIAQLKVQKVSDSQIAIIYGWRDEHGFGDSRKVREELAKPGTHFNPKTWVHPSFASQQADIDRFWQAREPRPRLFDVVVTQQPAKEQIIPSVDELIKLRAPIAQIVRLHGLTEDQVREEARKRDVDLEERFIRPGNAKVAHHERMAELDGIEDEVRQMRTEARKSKEAATAE